MSTFIYRIAGKHSFFIVNHDSNMTTLTSYPLGVQWENSTPINTITLKPAESRLLMLLLWHDGGTVSKAAIMEHVWKNRVVTDNSLRQVILSLRNALDDRIKPHHILKNIPGTGYCLANGQRIDLCEKADINEVSPATSFKPPVNNVSLFKKIWRMFMAS